MLMLRRVQGVWEHSKDNKRTENRCIRTETHSSLPGGSHAFRSLLEGSLDLLGKDLNGRDNMFGLDGCKVREGLPVQDRVSCELWVGLGVGGSSSLDVGDGGECTTDSQGSGCE